MPNHDLFSLGALFDSGDELSGDEGSGSEAGDIVGDIVGDNGMAGDIVGALARRGLLARGGGRDPRPASRGRRSASDGTNARRVSYEPFKPTKVRRYTLGFVKPVPLGATADVTNQPQLPFRPERIVVPSVVGGYFSILDLKIGNKSQSVASGGLPALMFSEQAVGTDLELDTAGTSQNITFTVENLDAAAAHIFQAGLIGTAMDGLGRNR